MSDNALAASMKPYREILHTHFEILTMFTNNSTTKTVSAGMAICLLSCVVALSFATVAIGEDGEPSTKPNEAKPRITFDDHIAPMLKRRCSSCHSADRTEADLDVTNFVALMQGGGSGVVIEAGSADDSYLYRLVNHDDSPEMPPSGTKIPEAEILQLKQWIEMGALENSGSKAKKRKPKIDLTKVAANPNQRPEVTPLPPRLSRDPVLWTPRKSPVRSIAVNPWSPVAAVAAPKQIVLFDTNTLELIGVVPFPAGQPETLRFSRNGSILLIGGGVGGDSGKVVMWDVPKGKVIATIGEELDSVLACDISPDHSMVALGGPKKRVKVYSTANGELLYEVSKHTEWITAIEFSPDGKNLASGDRNGGLIVSDATTGTENFNLSGHKSHLTSLSFRVDGKVLASASTDKTVRIWEMKKGKQIKNWGADSIGVTEVSFLPNGKLLTAGRSKQVKHWQQDGKAIQTFKGLSDVAMGLAFCDESKRVIAGSFKGELKVWELDKPESIGDLNSNPPPIVERIADLQPQVNAAQSAWRVAESAARAHQQQIEQIMAETIDATNQMEDAQARKLDAVKKAEMATAEMKAAKASLADADSANRGAEEVKGLQKTKASLEQQLTVLGNQQIAFEGAAGALAQRIAELQQETGRLQDALAPLEATRNAKQVAFEKLKTALDFWKDELQFAESQFAESQKLQSH